VASVVRLNSGGSTTVEKLGLTLEQAKELAAYLREEGKPPGCAWCVGLEEEEEEADAKKQGSNDFRQSKCLETGDSTFVHRVS
jgi:hypothetical protein